MPENMNARNAVVEHPSTGRFAYPPGGILIWLILSVELMTFIPGLIAFFHQANQAPADFSAGAAKLSTLTGSINTAILIVGGYFMAVSLQHLRAGNQRRAATFIWLATLSGVAFLIIKAGEYAGKLNQGLTVESGEFFTFYWLITGFHFVHVLVAVVLLVLAALTAGRPSLPTESIENIETIGVFWHMCDLIWILVFPTFYLMV